MPEHADQQPNSSSSRNFTDVLLDWTEPTRVLHFLLRSRTRWVICWIIALGAGAFVAEEAWRGFNAADREDGNAGHTTIDFGGQWLMGRMIVEGYGQHLYDRKYLHVVAYRHYPPRDAEPLMSWLAGTDDSEAPTVYASFLGPLAASNALDEAVLLADAQENWTPAQLDHVTTPRLGGALYPPVHAVLYAPLALLPPRSAYRVTQAFILALLYFAGWITHRLTQGRVWWPVASVFIMMFPGFSGCIALGQNGMFTLVLLLVGWQQLMRGREVAAGMCWGLLAFKPVWAAAFFLVPLLTARWRMAASMAVTGLAQCAVTLPVVGWHGWLNWLEIGRIAAKEYTRQENWIILSRDLISIPRRWLLVFEELLAKRLVWEGENAGEHPEDHPLPAILGWSLWIGVLAFTLFVLWRRPKQRKALTRPGAAFVLSGAVFSCYHFLYYDFLAAGLPVLVLFADPLRYVQFLYQRRPRWMWRGSDGFRQAESQPLPAKAWFVQALPLVLLLVLYAVPAYCCIRDPSYHFPPFDTFALLALWAWCGYQLLRPFEEIVPPAQHASVSTPGVGVNGAIRPAQLAELDGDVRGAHQRLTDQHSADAGRV